MADAATTADLLSRSVAISLARRGAAMALTAAASVVLARNLPPAEFGVLSNGLATSALLLGLTDLGFGQTLARALGRGQDRDGLATRDLVWLNVVWSALVAVAGLGLVAYLGPGTATGQVLAVLLPPVALAGFSCLRQVLYARHDVARLAVIDVATTAAQSAVLCAVVVRGGGVVDLAAVYGVTAVVNTLLVTRMVRAGGGVPPRPPRDPLRRRLARRGRRFRQAWLLGLSLFLPTAYFSVDLVLLGHLVPAAEVGVYAAAVKLLTPLAAVIATVFALALPHLAAVAGDRDGLTRLSATLVGWFAAAALPVTALLAVFAPAVVDLLYGPTYAGAAGVLRVLMAAAALLVLSNLVTNLMIALGAVRAMLVANSLALALNVAGNLLLVPRAGVLAAAWLTVASEAFVAAAGLWVVRRHVRLRALPGPSLRPAGCLVLACLAAVAARGPLWHALPVAAGYAAAVTLARGWPAEFRRALRSPARAEACAGEAAGEPAERPGEFVR